MAIRLPDGSIRLADGRTVFANSLVQGQDLLEILELVVPGYIPAPLWPFISGGGGGGGSGIIGADGADGTQGSQGNQGPGIGSPGPQGNQGIEGVQGNQGNQGATGSGAQGNQGNQGSGGDGAQGAQGNQGAAGIGTQGNQGNQGNQGTAGIGTQGAQGNQGAAGTGAQGNQGNQGNQGFQGSGGAGVQGAQGNQGSQGTQGALSADIYAATRVVSLIAGDGTDLTIAAAVAALPARGGEIFIKQGVYVLTSAIVIPPGMQIIFQGSGSDFNASGDVSDSSTLLDISGTAAISAFTQAGGASPVASTCYFRDFAVIGDNTTAQAFVSETGPTAGMNIDCQHVNVYRVKDIVRTVGDIEASFTHCYLQPSALATSSFFRNTGTGGELMWHYVEATLGAGTSEGILSGAFPAPDWRVTDSYVGGPTASVFDVNVIKWNNFRLDAADITIAGTTAQVEQCELIGVSLDFEAGIVNIGDTQFIGTPTPAYIVRFGGAKNTVSGCDFSSSNTRAIDVLAAATGTVISGNSFTAHSTEEVRTASTGTVVTGNQNIRVTETGAANANKFADIADTSTIIGSTTIVTDWNTRAVAASITLDITHRTALVDATAAARTITLPTAASSRYRVYSIKKIDASANTVTIDGAGAETIDGATTQVLTTQYQSVTIQSDGTTWWII